jgi:hypothetical protein
LELQDPQPPKPVGDTADPSTLRISASRTVRSRTSGTASPRAGASAPTPQMVWRVTRIKLVIRFRSQKNRRWREVRLVSSGAWSKRPRQTPSSTASLPRQKAAASNRTFASSRWRVRWCSSLRPGIPRWPIQTFLTSGLEGSVGGTPKGRLRRSLDLGLPSGDRGRRCHASYIPRHEVMAGHGAKAACRDRACSTRCLSRRLLVTGATGSRHQLCWLLRW